MGFLDRQEPPMKVSLIITTYNNAIVLKKVLESIMKQTLYPSELIVAEDGRDEANAAYTRYFSDIAPFSVLHVTQEHKGFRAARLRNKAIKQSAGDYIILLDGDCVVNSHFVSDHVFLSEEGCFIQGKRVIVEKKAVEYFSCEHANSFSSLMKMALTGGISNTHHVIRLPFDLSIKSRKLKGIKSCNMGFFKKDVLAVNGFNEDFVGWGNEDSELACRFFRYGLRKKVHSFMAICFHLWHPSNKGDAKGNRDLLEATLRSKEYFCANGLVGDAAGNGDKDDQRGVYSSEAVYRSQKSGYPWERS